MPSAVTTQASLVGELFVRNYDHDPGATTAVICSPDGGTTPNVLDGRDYLEFMVVARPTVVGGAGLTTLEIVAATDSAMSASLTVIKTVTIAADDIDDNAVIACRIDELPILADNLRYLAARLTMGTATDEANVTYIAKARRPQLDLTATLIN
jgi:hypothetical protein